MCRSFGDFKPLSERVKASGIKLVCQVQTIEQAAAVVPLGADAVVAQVPQFTWPLKPLHTQVGDIRPEIICLGKRGA